MVIYKKKEKNVTDDDHDECGDVYTLTAMESDTKLFNDLESRRSTTSPIPLLRGRQSYEKKKKVCDTEVSHICIKNYLFRTVGKFTNYNNMISSSRYSCTISSSISKPNCWIILSNFCSIKVTY